MATYIVFGQVVRAWTTIHRFVGIWVPNILWKADFYKTSKAEVHLRFQERAIDRLYTMVTRNV